MVLRGNKMISSDKNLYFAAKEATECASIVLDKASSYYNLLKANAYLVKLQMMWRAYYGAYTDDAGYGHRINFTGNKANLYNYQLITLVI